MTDRRRSTSCMSCARRSAGCSATSSTWRAARRRAATGRRSSPTRRPAARGPRRRSRRWRRSSRSASPGSPMSRAASAAATSPRSRMSRGASAEVEADVVHGHGAKGGAYARLARARRGRSASTRRTAAACTTAGARPPGCSISTLERVLMRAHRPVPVRERLRPRRLPRQDRRPRRALVRVVHNGVAEAEFAPVAPDAGRDRPRLHRRVARAQGRRRADRGDRAARARRPHASPRRSSATARTARRSRRAVAAHEPRRRDPLRRRQAGARGLCARPAAGGSVARGIAALYRARGGRRRRCRSSPPGSAASPKSSGPMPTTWSRRAIPRRWRDAIARGVAGSDGARHAATLRLQVAGARRRSRPTR